jgi:CBS domain-containing protein
MTSADTTADATYQLSDLIGGKAHCLGRTVGKLADLIVTDQDKLPEVTHLLIDRPFGHRSLMVPWAKVEKLEPNGQTILAVDTLEPYEGEPAEGQICLRDHVLDKKVVDCDDDEVEVVYDIKLTAHHGRLYVIDVDCSRAGLLRRIGLRWLANLIRSTAATIDDEVIPWTYVQRLPQHMGSFDGNVKLNLLKAKLPEMHPADLADILEELDHGQRMAIFNQLDTEHASDTLEEIEPRVQREVVSSLPIERTAELVDEMTPGQAADVLAALPMPETEAILQKIDPEEATKIRALIEKHDDRIIDFTTTHYIAFPPEITVGEVLNRFRVVAKEADVVMYVYVCDPANVLLGVIDIKELLRADPAETLGHIMITNIISLDEHGTVADAYKLFARYSFRAIPIVGKGNVMKGAIPYRDIMQLDHHFV